MEWWLGSEIFFTSIIKARSQRASVVPAQLWNSDLFEKMPLWDYQGSLYFERAKHIGSKPEVELLRTNTGAGGGDFLPSVDVSIQASSPDTTEGNRNCCVWFNSSRSEDLKDPDESPCRSAYFPLLVIKKAHGDWLASGHPEGWSKSHGGAVERSNFFPAVSPALKLSEQV